MHVEEEITNNHGRLKRFVPEPDNQDKVCISIRNGNFLEWSKRLVRMLWREDPSGSIHETASNKIIIIIII